MTSPSVWVRRLGLLAVAVFCAWGVGCESTSSSTPTGPSGTLQVALASNLLKAGETSVVTAAAAGAPAAAPVWTSSDATVATVAATGVVQARRAGRATITATSGASVGQVSLRVVSDYAGSWQGSLVRAQPSCAPTSTAPVCARTSIPDTLLAPIVFSLAQTGGIATGTLVDALEPGLTVVLAGTVADGDVLTLTGATVSTATSTRQLAVTNLRATFDPTIGSITGSYTMVATTRTAAGATATDYSFQAQFRDLRRP